MPLIKFLSKKLTESFILNVYSAVSGGSDWASALVSATGPVADWAAEFYETLVRGDLSNYSPYTLHSNLAAGDTQEIGTAVELKVPTDDELMAIIENDEIPSLGQTTLSIGPYGAQLAALTIDDADLYRVNEGTDPVVSVSGGADLRVFSIRGSSVTVLPGTGGSVKLTDFKKLSGDKGVFLVLVTGLHDSGKQDYTVKVELQPYPTLDELVGEYSDSIMSFTDVYISPELKASASDIVSESENEDSELGCDIDLDILAAMETLKGTSREARIIIVKTGENTGTLAFISEDDEGSDTSESDVLPFTYQNGLLLFDHSAQGAYLTGDLLAAYGKNKDVTIDGDLRMTASGEEIRVDIHLSGSKPLPAK